MFLKKMKTKDGRVYLSLVNSYRHNGVPKQAYIENLGYLDELEKQYEDPITHFKQIAKQRTAESKNEPVLIDINVKLNSSLQRKNVGYVVLQKIYYQLGIDKFLQKKQRNENVEYRFNDILRLLTFSRILSPASVKATHENKGVYFEKFDFSLKDTYRSLSKLLSFKDDLLAHLYKALSTTVKLDTSHAYYDCTNYYFEINYNDEDTVDADNNIKPGLRKRGYGKDHKPKPLVGMGLLLDNQGIPISYDIFPGNRSEKLTLRPILNQAKARYQLGKVVVVADRGLNTSDNIFFNNNEHNGYIFSKSIRGADEEFINWALSEDLSVEQHKIKSRITPFDITIKRNDKRNTKTTAIQKQVVYYSEKYAKRAKHKRELVLEKARDLIANPSTYNRATSVGAVGYIKNLSFSKKTGEVIDRNLSLDIEKVIEEERFDGYYAIVTNEVEMTDEQVIEQYKGLWKIEDSFKVLKSELRTRPIYMSTEDHIKAHFFICYIALVIIRVLEKIINNEHSTAALIKAINRYSCSYVEQNIYMFDYRSKIIEDFERLFNLDLSAKYHRLSGIKNILKKK